MWVLRIGRLLVVTVLIAALESAHPAAASATSDGDYDTFDSVTLNDLDSAGNEIGYAGPARRFDSASVDTTMYTLQPGEEGATPTLNSCLRPDSSVASAGRTAWVRFDPAANGRIDVVTETPSYDSVLFVRTAVQRTWRSATFADLQGPQACTDLSGLPGNESVTGFPVAADRVYYVQVGAVCAAGASTCGDPATQGGLTRIQVTFTPYDADGDGVADSLDNCEGTGLPGAVTTDGCADSDGDRVADGVDDCPALPGVPAPAPYHGCPAGPIPPDPASTPYVVIESLDGDLYSTPRRKVRLRLNWPKGTMSASISNLKSKVRTKTVADMVTWRLQPAKRSATRGVRVRFRGPGVPDVIVGDTIEFDPAPPELPEAVLLPSGQGWYVGLLAEDPGTGVGSIAVLNADQQPIDDELVCGLDQCDEEVDIAFSTKFARPAFVEITDAAGNARVVTLEQTRAATNCAYVPYRDPAYQLECVRVAQRCGRLKPLLRWRESNEVRCRRVDSDRFRVVHV